MYKKYIVLFAALVAASCSDDKETKPKDNTATDMSADAADAADLSADLPDDMADAAPDTGPACVPSAELCNGVDDDCDLLVDEGCPDEGALVTFVGAEADWTLGIAGGQALRCAPNAATSGLVVSNDSTYVRGLRAQCVTARIEKSRPDGAEEFAYTLVFTPGSSLPGTGFAGAESMFVQDFGCGADMVSNADGMITPGSYVQTAIVTRSTNLLGGVSHRCSTYSITRDMAGKWVATRDPGVFSTQWTSHDPAWGESFYECQNNQVATGYDVSFAGAEINGLTMKCADVVIPTSNGQSIDPNKERSCTDGLDDDNDGLTDCQDSDCADVACGLYGQTCMSFLCQCPNAGPETSCDDGEDNDCDGLIDCQDSDCGSRSCGANGRQCEEKICVCATGAAEQCNNGVDDNCDGLADCADPGCAGQLCDNNGGTCNVGQCACTPKPELCNGVDDDCDGYADDGCPDVSRPLTFGGAESWMPKRGGGGGTQQQASCGSIGVVGGVHVWSHDVVDRIQLQCYSLKLQPRMVNNEFVYDVVRDVQTNVPDPHIGNPNNGSRASETNCGAGGPPGYVTGINSIWGGRIDQLQAECSQGVLRRNGSGQWELQLTYTHNPPATLRYPTGVPNQSVDRCPANMAVTGMNAWWGENIDAAQFRCNAASWSMTDVH